MILLNLMETMIDSGGGGGGGGSGGYKKNMTSNLDKLLLALNTECIDH